MPYEVQTTRRGTARGVPREFLDVTTPFSGLFGLSDITLLLGNLRSEVEWFAAAAKGSPDLSSERLGRLATVVNLAIKKARGRRLPVRVLPELSVPREWLRPLVARMLSDGIGTVVGLEYERIESRVFNHAVAVMSTGRHGSAVAIWKKKAACRARRRQEPEPSFARLG